MSRAKNKALNINNSHQNQTKIHILSPLVVQTKAEEYYTGEYDYGTVDGSQTDPQPDSTTPDQVRTSR